MIEPRDAIVPVGWTRNAGYEHCVECNQPTLMTNQDGTWIHLACSQALQEDDSEQRVLEEVMGMVASACDENHGFIHGVNGMTLLTTIGEFEVTVKRAQTP